MIGDRGGLPRAPCRQSRSLSFSRALPRRSDKYRSDCAGEASKAGKEGKEGKAGDSGDAGDSRA